MKTISIIDTFGYFFRNFYAMPKLKSKDGKPSGVLLGFVNLVNQLYNDETDYIVFALEGEGQKFRKNISSDYKANRTEIDVELSTQIKTAIDWIKKMNLPYISIYGYEADDAIASIKSILKDVYIRIVSVDKDLYQLIDSNTYIYDPIKKKNIYKEDCYDKFGVYPEQFVDYQSLVGDSSDNVSGIKGIGAKSAQKLISNFNSLDGIYSNIPMLKNFLTPKLIDLVINGKDCAYKSRDLVKLRNDLLDFFDLESSLKPSTNPLFLLENELKCYDINILSKIKKDVKSPKNTSSLNFEYIKLTNFKELLNTIDSINESDIVAFDTETNSLDVKNADIVGFSFAFSLDRGYYVPLNHFYLGVEEQISLNDAKKALKRLFTHHIVGHNLKFDMAVVYRNFGLEINSYSDTLILAWLMDSSSMLNLDYQINKIFNYITIKFDDIVNKGDTFASVHIDIATKYGVQDSICSLALYYYFIKTLNSKLIDVARKVEFPFIKVLIDMEGNGIGVDLAFFNKLKLELENKIKDTSGKIYEFAGSEFNINSTRQLSDVLFNQLNLKKGRILKNSSYSTDERTLESIIDSHPIISHILEYREFNKLLNTYVSPIINMSINNRIYTSFVQTGTSTGRLSSRNPNLQNIPVKTDIGRSIRYGFVARDGYSLISADYSQIELRLLAHFSQDSNLVESFKFDKDIHLETAIKIFGHDLAKVNRNIAKSINFGLIYGMGAKKLAKTLNITQAQSKEYIDSYFKNFPTVKDYLQKQQDFILSNGYASTLLGRRRIFNFNNVTEYERLAFLREGVNSIFQGSAADLIKLAMNECFLRFKNKNVKLLVQVHDELIFEARDDEVSSLKDEILDIMNSVYTLLVPLKCGISIGKRWSELK